MSAPRGRERRAPAAFAAAALAVGFGSAAGAQDGAPGSDELLARARAVQAEVVETTRTSRHRQVQHEVVRGARDRVRAGGWAAHDVAPLPEGRFELRQQGREVEGDEAELGLAPPAQVQGDPAALTTAEAIARALETPGRFRLLGRETLGERETWALAFDALPEDATVKDVKERVRRASRGRLWIDVHAGAVVRLETELARAVDLLGGKVRATRVVREQGPALAGRWVPTVMEVESEVRVLTVHRARTVRTVFEGWAAAEPAPRAAAAGGDGQAVGEPAAGER